MPYGRDMQEVGWTYAYRVRAVSEIYPSGDAEAHLADSIPCKGVDSFPNSIRSLAEENFSGRIRGRGWRFKRRVKRGVGKRHRQKIFI